MDINTEVLQITTNPKNFFLEYLTIKKPVFEVALTMINKRKVKLNPKLMQVFSLIMYYNYKYRDMEDDLKWRMVFDYDTKVAIMNDVGINESHLNTYFSILRNIKLLNGKQISKPFIFYPESGFELTFKFNFANTEKNE